MPWTRATIGLLITAATLSGAPACKPAPKPRPVAVTRPHPIEGPTTQQVMEEQKEVITQNLISWPPLEDGINFKTPDGEIWIKYANGLMIHDVKKLDTRKPLWGQTVAISYVGTFPGKPDAPFDKSTPDKPLTFVIGTKDIVKGMNMGVSTMGLGAKRRIYIPGDLAYGADGNPTGGIGPNQDLIFDVELLSITGDGYPMPATAPTTGPNTMEVGPPLPPTTATAPATAPAK